MASDNQWLWLILLVSETVSEYTGDPQKDGRDRLHQGENLNTTLTPITYTSITFTSTTLTSTTLTPITFTSTNFTSTTFTSTTFTPITLTLTTLTPITFTSTASVDFLYCEQWLFINCGSCFFIFGEFTPVNFRGCEVYVTRIPRDCFENELVPIFSKIGKWKIFVGSFGQI